MKAEMTDRDNSIKIKKNKYQLLNFYEYLNYLTKDRYEIH